MYRFITGSFSLRRVALVLVEHVLIVLAVVLAAVVRLGVPATPDAYVDWVARSIVVAAVLQICLHYGDLYDIRTVTDRRDLLVGLLRALGAASVILAIIYYWIPGLVLGRGVFALATFLIISLVAGWRIAFEWLSL